MTVNGDSEYDRVREHSERAAQGNLAKEQEKLARQHKLFLGSPKYQLSSELVDPDGCEVIFKGELTNEQWKADFTARVARENSGKWSIRYLVVKERKEPEKAKPK